MFDSGKLEHLIGASLDDQRCVLERLLRELHDALPAMQLALAAQDWDTLRGYAHKYRGTSAVVGATACADVLGRLEQCLLFHRVEASPALMACLSQAIDDFDAAVTDYLGQYPAHPSAAPSPAGTAGNQAA